MEKQLQTDLLWYKDAIIYETHIRAFFDSDNDGIGDFKGLIEKLDYFVDLGVTAVWLLPFYPSPLKDDGYDIADYYSINPSYGTIRDFKKFLAEAHKRNIKVITELVLNHTSDQHDWFQRSRHAKPGSYWRNFYVWSDTPTKYKEARIIFKDFESSNWNWDPVAKSYYWHRFYSHQPDLNFDNPEVKKSLFKVVDFWFGMGVDGMRLDAVPYLYERENTSCENLPETHDFLRELRNHINERYPHCMLLSEANQWPEDSVAYFGKGDECHMSFHFPLMPRLFMALRMEDRYSIIDILKQTPEIPDNCQWAMFLRNHDELTLEMVTDEERDYMYKVYASDTRARINLGIRRRLAPLLGNDRRQIELLNGLLFSLPGTPVIYYGDEIGMGDNVYLGDRDSVRTPFQWSPDRNAGFSKANPHSLYLPVIISPEYHYETINVETTQRNSASLLWWMKNLIAVRKANPAFSRGKLTFLYPGNPKVLTFLRQDERTTILVVANLSRKVQYVEMDLSEHEGAVPVEMMGQVDFPPIGKLPYFLTLTPYAFYWFELSRKESEKKEEWVMPEGEDIHMSVEPLKALETDTVRKGLESCFKNYLPGVRWFPGKARKITRCAIEDMFFLPAIDTEARGAILIIHVTYTEGEPDRFFIPLGYCEGEMAERLKAEHPELVITRYKRKNKDFHDGVYYDPLVDPVFCKQLLSFFLKKRELTGKHGNLTPDITESTKRKDLKELPELTYRRFDQSNSSLMFDKKYYIKIFRKLEEGLNPDIQIGRFLTVKKQFPNVPSFIGSLVYQADKKEYSAAIMQHYVENETTAWNLMSDELSRFTEQVLAAELGGELSGVQNPDIFDGIHQPVPDILLELGGHGFHLAELLGRRTAELHVALGHEISEKGFEPEPFNPFYQRSLYQSIRNLVEKTFDMLRRQKASLSGATVPMAEEALTKYDAIFNFIDFIKKEPVSTMRIRVHGDYHLGQVLYTGSDFIILDFEGEPARSLGERQLKRSPLRDVAGMLRSFDYLDHYFLKEKVKREQDKEKLASWCRVWNNWMCVSFMKGYLSHEHIASLIPPDTAGIRKITRLFLLEKALYEVMYELGSRPDWVDIPLTGLLQILND